MGLAMFIVEQSRGEAGVKMFIVEHFGGARAAKGVA